MTEQIDVSEAIISLPEGKIFVKIWNPPKVQKDIPLVLLHDSLGCVETWKDFPEKLCRQIERQIIAYDRLGFGKSSARKERPSANFIEEEAETILPALLNALEIKTFSLLGHSVGGAMAIACAAKYPDSCQFIITESAQAFVEDRTREGILKAQENFEIPEIFAKLAKYHDQKTKWVLDAWIGIWLSAEFADWSLQTILPHVKCPALVIHGDQDEYGSIKFPQMISKMVQGPSEEKIIPDCGHIPHREKPKLILSLIADFLKPKTKHLEYLVNEQLREIPTYPEDLREYLQKLETSLQEAHDPEKQVSILGEMGVHFRRLDQTDIAKEKLLKALKLIEQNQLGLKKKIQQQIRLAHVFQWEKQYDQSNELFHQIISICRSSSDLRVYLDFALQHAGKNLFEQNRFQEALLMFEEALELRTQRNAPSDQIESTQSAIHTTQKALQTEYLPN